jgi:16S rRNA (adenine1518-N6/adenine1519-N6)-dimethyltransferase
VSTTSTGSSSRRKKPAGTGNRERVREELHQLGVRPRRSWGQSFLVDEFVADAEAALVQASRDAPIVEVGGGLGLLTAALLRRGYRGLTVVERDPALCRGLRRAFGSEVHVVEADALRYDWREAQALVSNFPFSIATPLLTRAFDLRVPEVVGLVQREVAERLGAGPGSRRYGRLSILTALYGTAELFQVVPPRAFEPEPEVESRLFRFVRRDGPLPVPSVPDLEALLGELFAGRRKQLKNLLPRVVRRPEVLHEVVEAAAWPVDWETRRPENLSPDAYFAFARALRTVR